MCPPWQWDFCLAIFQNFSRKHFSQDVYNPILSQPLGVPEWDESECGFIIVAKLLSRVRLFVTPQTTAHQSSLSFTISQNLLKLMSIESVMPSKYLILYHPLLLPSIFPSISVFSDESTLHVKWPRKQGTALIPKSYTSWETGNTVWYKSEGGMNTLISR